MILPVTDAHVRAAWDDYYRRPDGLEHIEIAPPLPSDHYHITILAALRQVLEADRKRVIAASHPFTITTGNT